MKRLQQRLLLEEKLSLQVTDEMFGRQLFSTKAFGEITTRGVLPRVVQFSKLKQDFLPGFFGDFPGEVIELYNGAEGQPVDLDFLFSIGFSATADLSI